MTAQPWDRFLTEQDREVLTMSGYGARAGFGQRRALLVDAFSYNDRCALVSAARFDRFDMGAKDADVVKSGEVPEFFAKLGSGLFAELPTGLANA